jgi:hypothetical protein
MLQWLPTKARKDERRVNVKVNKKPDLNLREGLRTKCKRATNLPAPRYMVIRQISPPRQTSRLPHKTETQEECMGRAKSSRRSVRQVTFDYVSHYDHNLSTLHTAAEHGDNSTIEKLFYRGVNVNARNENGETAMFIAALYNQQVTVQHLHHLGASVHIPDKLGQTPLFIATSENLVDVVKLLVKYGANVNTANTYGCTAMYAAAMNGCVDVMQYLHQVGANIDTANKTGEPCMENLKSLCMSLSYSWIVVVLS